MTRSMFGNNPEGAMDKNDGLHPSLMNMMEDRLRPFRAWVSWLCHFIGLHPMLRYAALSGLLHNSPERAIYVSEAVTPLAINISKTVTPLAINISKAVTPLAINISKAVTPLAINISTAVTPLSIKNIVV